MLSTVNRVVCPSSFSAYSTEALSNYFSSRALESAGVGHMITASIASSCHMTSSCPVADPRGDLLERTIYPRSLIAMPLIFVKLRRAIPSPSLPPEDKKRGRDRVWAMLTCKGICHFGFRGQQKLMTLQVALGRQPLKHLG